MDNSLAFKNGELPKVDLIDRLLLLVYIPIFLSVFIIFDLRQRLVQLLNKQAYKDTVVKMNAAFCKVLKITNVKLHISGQAKLDPNKSYIVISNHQSMYDMPLLSNLFKSHHPIFIAKREMGKGIPAISFNLHHYGHALIDRSNPRQSIPEIKSFAKRVEQEKRVGIIFPEGTRSRKGELRDFKTKGALTLLKYAKDSKVIPITFDNTWKLSARMSTLMPRNTEVEIIVGEAITRENKSDEEVLDSVYQVIKGNLERLRS